MRDVHNNVVANLIVAGLTILVAAIAGLLSHYLGLNPTVSISIIILFAVLLYFIALLAIRNQHYKRLLGRRRDGNPLFTGLERYFDAMWEHSDAV